MTRGNKRGNRGIIVYRNVRLDCNTFKGSTPVLSTDLCFWKTVVDGDPVAEEEWAKQVEKSRFFNHQPELHPISLIVNETIAGKQAKYYRQKNQKPVFQCFNITTKARNLPPLPKESQLSYFNRLLELHKPILMQFVDEILDIEGCPHIVKSKSDTGNA